MTNAYTLFRRGHNTNDIKSDTYQQPTHFISYESCARNLNCRIFYDNFARHVIVAQRLKKMLYVQK